MLLAIIPAWTNASQNEHQLKVEAYRAEAHAAGIVFYRLNPAEHGGLAAAWQEPDLGMELLRHALTRCGMYEAPEGAPADVEIFLSVSMHQRLQSESEAYLRFRPVTHRMRRVAVISESADGDTIKETRRALVPARTGYVGYNGRREPVEVYDKVVNIAARRASHPQAGGTCAELWRIEVRNSDGCSNPETFLPAMISAAMEAMSGATKSEGA